jgi:hypothetical protein
MVVVHFVPFLFLNGGCIFCAIPFPEWWLYILCHSFSWMVVGHFVDIGEIFYHHCINFFFIIKEKKFFSIHTVPLKITWLFWVAQVAKWLKLLTSDHKHTCITTNVGSCPSTHFKCNDFKTPSHFPTR